MALIVADNSRTNGISFTLNGALPLKGKMDNKIGGVIVRINQFNNPRIILFLLFCESIPNG